MRPVGTHYSGVLTGYSVRLRGTKVYSPGTAPSDVREPQREAQRQRVADVGGVRVPREYPGSTLGLGVPWSTPGVPREYPGSTREYPGSTQEYHGSTPGVPWEYPGSACACEDHIEWRKEPCACVCVCVCVCVCIWLRTPAGSRITACARPPHRYALGRQGPNAILPQYSRSTHAVFTQYSPRSAHAVLTQVRRALRCSARWRLCSRSRAARTRSGTGSHACSR